MKNLERVRSSLNQAISSRCSKETVLLISRYLDALIVEKMKQQIRKKASA